MSGRVSNPTFRSDADATLLRVSWGHCATTHSLKERLLGSRADPAGGANTKTCSCVSPRIDREVKKWFAMTGADVAKPKELMRYLVKQDVFSKDHREGLSAEKHAAPA